MANKYKLLNPENLSDEISPSNTNMDNDGNENLTAENTLMTESYSEILNSLATDTNNDLGVETNAPIAVIAKRRPNSLSRHHSTQCKPFVLFSSNEDRY